MLDLIIQNVTIVDGTGSKPYVGAVGVQGGKIVTPGTSETATKTIDGTGLHVAPGFIDPHSHSDFTLTEDFPQLIKVSQGVTTEIVGHCGVSAAPVALGKVHLLQDIMNKSNAAFPKEMDNWTTYSAYAQFLNARPRITNCNSFIGLSSLRIAVMGFDNRKPTQQELGQMKDLVADAMQQGAMGLSSGLVYPPGCYADIDEIAALASVVKKYDGLYTSHLRDESNALVEAVAEAIEVGRRTGVTVLISHHKVLGKSNWGLQKQTLKMIEAANFEGIDVLCDQYPYTRNMTSLCVCIPPRHFDRGIETLAEKLKDEKFRRQVKLEMAKNPSDYDNYYLNAGGWDGILVCSTPNSPGCEGLTVQEYADKIGRDAFDTYFDLIIENKGQTLAVYSSMCDEDVFEIALAPNTVVGSDGIATSLTGKTHPRTFGTFPRAICYYNKENKIMSLEQVVRKMTSQTAKRLGIKNRGRIQAGYHADLVVFDYKALQDKATYVDSTQLADGIEYVIVNGKIVYHDKKLTGEYPGKVLKLKSDA